MFDIILFIASIICSIMSQLPFFVESGSGVFLKYTWILPFFTLLFRRPQYIFSNTLLPFYSLMVIFGSYCFICYSFSGIHYIGRDFLNICISSMIALVSYMFWKEHGSINSMTLVVFSVLVSCVILAYVVDSTYLARADIMSRVYAYKSKNSISSILYCAVILAFFVFYVQNKFIRISVCIFIAYLFYVILLLRSRATIAGFAFVLYFFIFKSGSRRIKALTIIISIAAVLAVFSIPSLYDIIVNGILFAARDVEDFNDLTSGRTYLVSEGIEMFFKNIWFGRGNLYLDCMPLVMLVQYGVLGASVVFVFLFKIGRKINSTYNMSKLTLVAFLLFYSFIINSLFEAQPPFGPGIKCFMLWMTIGFMLAELEERRLIANGEKSIYDMIKL